jgi:hypothetical protein
VPGLIAQTIAGPLPDDEDAAVGQGLIAAQLPVAQSAVPQQVYGYPVREQLFGGESEFFRANPTVTGMAAEDGQIILNPYSTLQPQEREAVARNEAIRLHMRDRNIVPQIDVTPEQEAFFRGTAYETADAEKRQTIIARILSGDPSVKSTPEQQREAERIMQTITGYGNRTDGAPKGKGFFGELARPDGNVSTELAIGIDFGQGEMEVPLLVPTLTRAEIDYLLEGGEPTDTIVGKAVKHAQQRLTAGMSPFAAPDEMSALPE